VILPPFIVAISSLEFPQAANAKRLIALTATKSNFFFIRLSTPNSKKIHNNHCTYYTTSRNGWEENSGCFKQNS
jgi:hypothetical protein